LARPAPRALKASKDPSGPRAQSESRGQLALRDHKDQSARRGRREMLVAKAQSDPPASADHQGLKVPRAHPAPPDQLARRATPARHRQFAWSRVRIALAAETTKSWLVLFARAVRPTARSARPLARQQPVCVHVGDLRHRVATSALKSGAISLDEVVAAGHKVVAAGVIGFRARKEALKAQICDAHHRPARRYFIYQSHQTHILEEGRYVMTWTSDRAGVVLYTVLGMLVVLSSIYIPA
jgi:hypothetical protein